MSTDNSNTTTLSLYCYKTGTYLRELTSEESARYLDESDNGTCAGGTGAVDGKAYGHDGAVYAN